MSQTIRKDFIKNHQEAFQVIRKNSSKRIKKSFPPIQNDSPKVSKEIFQAIQKDSSQRIKKKSLQLFPKILRNESYWSFQASSFRFC
jgi:Ca2+-binding EF-hand superfamily protein